MFPTRAVRVLVIFVLLSIACHANDGDPDVRIAVADASGAAITDAAVTVAGTTSVIRTGKDGIAELHIAAGAAKLHITAPGFQPANLAIAIPAQPTYSVVLRPAAESQTISVLARGSEAQVNELAESTQVILGRDLRRSGTFALDDALRQAPGFSLFRRSGSLTANPTSQGVSLRGVGASGASRALVLADGVPLNDPFGGWVYWNMLPRAEVQQVEVLEGGASNLYGSSALSGVIDVARVKPAAPLFMLEGSQGSYGTPEGSAYAAITPGKWQLSF